MTDMESRNKIGEKQQFSRRNKALKRSTELNSACCKLLLAILLFSLVLGGSPAPLSAGNINWIPVANTDTAAAPEAVTSGGSATAPQMNPGLAAADVGAHATCPSSVGDINPEQKVRAEKLLAQLPLNFIQNQGQLDKQVLFYTQGQNQELYFTSRGLTFSFSQNHDSSDQNELLDLKGDIKNGPTSDSPQRWAVKLDFIGADPSVKARGEAAVPTPISYFKGNPQDWRTGIDSYSRLVYPDLWPGIDLIFKGDAGSLKYEFAVSPGADPAQIRLAWRGAGSVSMDEQGQMEIKTPLGSFTDEAPLAWQEGGEGRTAVSASYFMEASRKDNALWGFNLGSYDPARELIIDPAILDYCGYIGGSNRDDAYSIAVDSSGRAYVTGVTASTVAKGFPVSGGPDSSYNGGAYDVFVARVASDGLSLDYCSYIGGTDVDAGNGIAVDSSGRAYVTGHTSSSGQGFPVCGGLGSGHVGAFVARVASDGLSLEYCGYIGGSDVEVGNGIAVDSSGRAYVTGYTNSTESQGFPVSVGPDSSHNGGEDVFVARVAADGNSLEYCGYIGGSQNERGTGIAVDGSGRAYVTGYTASTESQGFPVGGGADSSHNGGEDAFVARVASDGLSLEYCGYIGGSQNEQGKGIAVDGSGRAYIAGYTKSTKGQGFPAGGGADSSHNGREDVFVARVAADGLSLEYCSYIGGSQYEQGTGIAVDSSGRAYVTGYTDSTEATFPVSGGLNSYLEGGRDAFVARVAGDGHSLDYCGYIGGSQPDMGYGIAVDGEGIAYVTGYTESAQDNWFPVSGGPDIIHNGVEDVFVARVLPRGDQNDILGFTLPEQSGPASIDNVAHTVYMEVTSGTNLASLTPTITVSAGASINPASGTARNFTAPVSYTVSAENGDSQDWTVNVTVAASGANDILSFTLPEQSGPAIINNVAHSINIEVVSGTNPASLTPTITVSAGAGINPASGTARNFSNPVSYTVSAENGDSQDWTVNVTVAASGANDILSFTLPEQTGPAIINNVAHSINMEVVSGTNPASLTPTITVSAGAGINPASGTARDFTAPVTYTVTAENGDPRDWTVNVTMASSTANDILSFTLPEQSGPAIINNVAHSINIEVVSGTNPASLTPTITVSAGAGINPASGTTRDFTAPVTYTVTAENGDPQDWKVNVTVAGSSHPHSGGGDDSNPPADAGLLITRIGGIIKQDNVSITFPNGAVENDIRVIIKQISQNSGLNTPASAQLLSRIMDIVKDKSGNFLKAITITLSFDKSKIDPDEYDIGIYCYDENAGQWIVLQNIVLDLEGGRVSGDIKHFSKFAVLATSKPASSQPPMIFHDIAGHWAQDSIIKLINAGVVSGYPDGTFQPNKAVSRAEFTVMLVKAMNLETRAGNTFTDTASHWAKESIATAAAYGIVSGYDAVHFGPDDLITREQAAAIISRAAKLEAAIEAPGFTDCNQISLWAKAAVAVGFQNEFITGYPDGSFRPRENTSRAEAAFMIGKIR